MRFSVIVASYNYESLVIEALESLMAQTFRDFEVVVVDDGSTDGSVASIERFIAGLGEADVRVRLLTHPDKGNHGLPATIKLGVRQSLGQYVAFCEADDLWTPTHLAEVAKVVEKTNGKAGFIVNDVELFGNAERVAKFDGIRRARRTRLKDGENRISPAVFRDANYVLTFSAACVRRDLLLACDFHPIGRPSALDWWLWRQVAYDNPLYYIDRALTKWRMHASQMTRSGAADGLAGRLAECHAQFVAAGNALLRRRHPLSARWRLLRTSPAARWGFQKWLRGALKRAAPYALQRRYAYRTYGILFPDLGFVMGVLPFGVVCALKRMDPDNGMWSGGEASSLPGLCSPHYRLAGKRRKRFLADRAEGLSACREMIARNAGVRVLVVLHLFYERAWPVVRSYLENLTPYRCDLVVTIPKGACSERTLSAVRDFMPSARIVECENRGFDVGPFVLALNDVELDDYDIVFKLHSKGIRRPFIFIYGQVFKYADWFFNLFNGVLGGNVVHRLVDALVKGEARLAAAENLVVSDPPHKRRFVKAFCEKRGIPYDESYRFVAGSCFAVRAEVFKPIQAMRLVAEDFPPVERGVFSAAHALERIICFPAAGAIRGYAVEHAAYPDETAEYAALSALRLLDDPRFILDDDFFYRVLEARCVRKYEVARVRLGDIRRRRNDGSVCPLEACEPFRYLRGDTEAYEAYCRENREVTGFSMSPGRFEALRSQMEDYDPRCMPVIHGPDNVVMDGQHRCCILLDRYGPDYEIEVLRIW